MSQAETVQTQTEQSKVFYRLRLTYARREALRYVSHLDMQMVWERTLRRADAPLAYSQGFNPKPRLHMASALPLGFLSRCELADLWLELPATDPAPEAARFAAQVQAAAPPGLEILQAEQVPLEWPALQTQVQAAEYQAVSLDALEAEPLTQAVQRLLAAPQLLRERRGKPYDLRPLVESLQVQTGADGLPALLMRLSAREGATGRPEEVLDALGLQAADFRVERTALILAV